MFMYSNLDLSDLAFELFRLFSRHSWRKANVTKLDSCGETQSGDCKIDCAATADIDASCSISIRMYDKEMREGVYMQLHIIE